MIDDAELLRSYADERSEEAFTELVRRHIGLVYHTALRRCGGDAHRAEDVAQHVFTAMAAKAGRLARHPALASWLHTSTRYTAAQAMRAEARRLAREERALRMNADLEEAESPIEWARLQPAIDDALAALNENDREAILLRFFEGHGFAEIGQKLRLNEDAARMRVGRALEKMRRVLARRSVTSTAAALGASLTGQAMAAVPVAITASVTSAAFAGAAAGGGVVATVFFMGITKLQIGTAVAIVVVGAAGLIYQHRSNVRLSGEVAALRERRVENMRLRAENNRLASAASELERMRAENTELKARAGGSPAKSAGAASGLPAPVHGGILLAAGLAPVETLGNSGRATPRAAWATQLWAARTGDISLEADLLTFGPEARARLEALLATLPQNLRAEYDTPEKLMAFVLAGSPHPVGGMQVLGETANGADDTILHTQWQHADDDIVHQSDVELVRQPDGWKMVVPPSLVNRAVYFLTRNLPPSNSGNGGGK